MPVDKTLSQKYQEMVEVLRDITNTLARLEERCQFFKTNFDNLQQEFSKHKSGHEGLLNEINSIKIKIESLETTFRDFPHAEVVKQIHGLKTELAPYSKFMDDIKDIPEKVRNLEKEEISVKSRWKTVTMIGVTFIVNLIWIVIASYILLKFGLQAPNTPSGP